MQTPSPAHITRLCRTRLDRYLASTPGAVLPLSRQETLEEICSIVQRNLENGRRDRYARNSRNRQAYSFAGYVDRVIASWVVEYPRVRSLSNKDAQEWGRLVNLLRKSAERIQRRVGAGHSIANSAEDYAQWACRKIRESVFPFDVVFDAWAVTILRHLVLERYRSSDLLDHPHHSIDELLEPDMRGASPARVQEVPDGQSGDRFTSVEHQELLEQALKEMSSDLQREVIRLTFFEGWDDVRIAKKLGKSPANIQTLRHRALKKLNEIMDRTG
ncbi:MAG: RNA polymerase sigma factor [Anaerolineae bacterium]